MVTQSLCVNFTTTTKSTTCCWNKFVGHGLMLLFYYHAIGILNLRKYCPWTVAGRFGLNMHSWAISDGQAFRRSLSTQIVLETIELLGEAKQLRVEDLG
eukprot:4706598-Pleurochrysis_carterae.AAC.1